jgi:hypothetical protein
MDLRTPLRRTAVVRKVLVVLVMVAIASLAAAGVAGGDHTARRVSVSSGLSVRVPVGWHVLRGWLSDVTDPSPRLAWLRSRRGCPAALARAGFRTS